MVAVAIEHDCCFTDRSGKPVVGFGELGSFAGTFPVLYAVLLFLSQVSAEGQGEWARTHRAFFGLNSETGSCHHTMLYQGSYYSHGTSWQGGCFSCCEDGCGRVHCARLCNQGHCL